MTELPATFKVVRTDRELEMQRVDATLRQAGGLLVLLPFTVLEALWQPGPPFSAKALWLIVLAGLLPGFFSYQAYGYMLRELGAARSSLVMYLSPVYAAFTAWVLLGEAPKAYHAVGAALILPAIWLATRKGAAQ